MEHYPPSSSKFGMFILNQQKCGDVGRLWLPNIQITFDLSNLANGSVQQYLRSFAPTKDLGLSAATELLDSERNE